MQSFWQNLNKPILALAPMEDVTDTVFREIVLSVSNPDLLSVLFTEFTSTDGLCSEKGRNKVMERLLVSDNERELLKKHNTRLVAQIWGSEPEKFYQSAKMISELGIFDGIDINMGCPVKKVLKHKSCSALINYPVLADEIIQSSKEGSNLPVSVKTRLGFKNVVTEEWIGHLLKSKPDAITIHGRTQKMMSFGPVLWDEIAKAVQIRNNMESSVALLGNGDILDYHDALTKINDFGLDGIMIGRGIFKNPWVFNNYLSDISLQQKIGLLQKHVDLFEETWGNSKNYNELKRFYKIYINGFAGAAEWRDQLMKTNNYVEVTELVQKFKYQLSNQTEPVYILV